MIGPLYGGSGLLAQMAHGEWDNPVSGRCGFIRLGVDEEYPLRLNGLLHTSSTSPSSDTELLAVDMFTKIFHSQLDIVIKSLVPVSMQKIVGCISSKHHELYHTTTNPSNHNGCSHSCSPGDVNIHSPSRSRRNRHPQPLRRAHLTVPTRLPLPPLDQMAI